jgi:signal transduction histidine kinase
VLNAAKNIYIYIHIPSEFSFAFVSPFRQFVRSKMIKSSFLLLLFLRLCVRFSIFHFISLFLLSFGQFALSFTQFVRSKVIKIEFALAFVSLFLLSFLRLCFRFSVFAFVFLCSLLLRHEFVRSEVYGIEFPFSLALVWTVCAVQGVRDCVQLESGVRQLFGRRISRSNRTPGIGRWA